MANDKQFKPEVFNTFNNGSVSDEILFEENAVKTQEEIESKLFGVLSTYKHDGEICWGSVYAVEPLGMHTVVCVLYNGQKVSIPDIDYFEPTYDFGKKYPSMTASEQAKKRFRCASYQIGAKVCFTISDVKREVIKEGEHAGEYSISIIGSRVKAMETLRDIYFWHKNRKIDSSKPPRSVTNGSLVKAHVLAVKEDSVLVECVGVETKLFSFNLLNNEIVENCSDHVHPGDTLKVKVKTLHLNADGSVHLAVTGRLNEVSKLINTIKVKSPYLGTVESYNEEKKSYTIILAIGVIATVSEENVVGRCTLVRGDKVSVFVAKVYSEFVSGSAMKL